MFNAVTFAKNAAFSQRHASEFLNRTKDYFKWNVSEEMLDIGCADGNLTKNVLYPFVEARLNHLYGGDSDRRAIEVARKLYATEKLSFAQMDVEDDQCGSTNQNKFDHIFAFYLLHWVSLYRWPNNLFKMTKRGGQLFASILLAPNALTETMQTLRYNTDRSWWQNFEGYQSKFQNLGSAPVETITCSLRNAGFVVDMIDILEVQMDFPSRDALLTTLLCGDPLEERMSQEMYMEFLMDFYEKLTLSVEARGTGYIFNSRVLVFIASKP